MTRREMKKFIMADAVRVSGIDETDPRYLGAMRELERHTDADLQLLVNAIKNGTIYEAARNA